jgi:hypothetical protein
VTDTIHILRTLATEMGGTVLAEGDRSVGFSMYDGEEKSLLKLVAEDDSIILEQLNGREKGKRAEVGTLSWLKAGMGSP